MKVVVLTTSYPRHADDVAGALRPRRRASSSGLRGRRRRGRLAGVVPPLRDRLRRRDRRTTCGARPWKLLLLPAFLVSFARGGAAGGAGRRPRSRPLASLGAAGAGHRTAVRAPALGLGRRARATRRCGWRVGSFGARASSSVASTALAARRPRARRPRRARDPERRRRSPRRSARARRAAARALRRSALRGEGRPRPRGGGGRPPAGGRR